ncbi:hypothetical protein HPB48_003085 [Haemaphysalis longicornis]|uniref:Uncharacterized protein n=1 Tax=Haemaphysalis longicornis TaxID=44386 RepID=A0A9J6G3A2_HAELO|nr:hypothetical protein HPB48_003085 [Haemaphysalis longicornis]
MENEDAIIASCSHPYFKMRWAPNEVPRASDFESLLLRAAEAHGPDHKNSYDDTSSAPMYHGFYDFEEEDFPTSGRSEQTHVRAEVFRYLDVPRKDFAMCQDFPAIKSVFVHYNTNLCSSAPVERLFLFASLVLRPNRRCLEDSLFEKLLLRKCNQPLKFRLIMVNDLVKHKNEDAISIYFKDLRRMIV